MLKLGICFTYTTEEAKKIYSEAKDDSLVIRLKEDPKKKFWDNRMYEIRRWNWCIIASNLLFQFSAIINPMNPTQLIVNILYTVGTVICIVLQGLTHFNKDYGCLT